MSSSPHSLPTSPAASLKFSKEVKQMPTISFSKYVDFLMDAFGMDKETAIEYAEREFGFREGDPEEWRFPDA